MAELPLLNEYTMVVAQTTAANNSAKIMAPAFFTEPFVWASIPDGRTSWFMFFDWSFILYAGA